MNILKNIIASSVVLAVLGLWVWWWFIREPFLGAVFVGLPAAALFIAWSFVTVAELLGSL